MKKIDYQNLIALSTKIILLLHTLVYQYFGSKHILMK